MYSTTSKVSKKAASSNDRTQSNYGGGLLLHQVLWVPLPTDKQQNDVVFERKHNYLKTLMVAENKNMYHRQMNSLTRQLIRCHATDTLI